MALIATFFIKALPYIVLYILLYGIFYELHQMNKYKYMELKSKNAIYKENKHH
jgi:hypothetical protein